MAALAAKPDGPWTTFNHALDSRPPTERQRLIQTIACSEEALRVDFVRLITEIMASSKVGLSGDPAQVPMIVKFAFKDFIVTSAKRSATCKICGVKITDGLQTTSNFVRHIKTHPDRYCILLFSFIIKIKIFYSNEVRLSGIYHHGVMFDCSLFFFQFAIFGCPVARAVFHRCCL